MKHLKFVIFGLVLVIALAAALYNIRQSGGHSRMEELVSDQAVLFMRFSNVKERLKDLEASPFWKHIRTIRLDGALPEKAQESDGWAQKAEKAWNDPIFQTLFGREVGVAVYPPVKGADPQASEPHFVVLSRLDHGGSVLDGMMQWAGRWHKDLISSEEDYKGATITRLASRENPQQVLYYVRIRNYLVMAMEQAPLRQSLDVAAKRMKRLPDDPVFHQTLTRLEETSEGVAFVHMARLRDLLEEQWADLRQNPWLDRAADTDLSVHLEQLQPFKGHGVTWHMGDKAIRSKMFTLMDIALYNKVHAYAPACPAGENGTWAFVPQNAIAYSWTNCQDFLGHWQDLKHTPDEELREGEASAEAISQRVYTTLGLSVEEDVLPVLGDQAAFAVGDTSGQAGLPIPPLLAIIKITNVEQAKVMMRELTDNPLLVRETDMYNGVSLNRLRLAFLSNAEAAYAVTKDYLLVSSDTSMLQRSLDVHSDPTRSLKSGKTFKAADVGLTQKNNSVAYLEPARLAQRVKEGVEWAQSIFLLKANQGQTFVSGARQKYDGITKDVETQERHIRENRERVKALSDKLAAMEANGESTSFQASQVESLEMEYQTLQHELTALQAQEAELRRTLETYEERLRSSQQSRTLVDGVLFPILDALSVFQAHTTRMRFEENGAIMESLTTLK